MKFIDKISIKGKAKNLTQLRKQVKVNDKSVAVDPLKCFNRLVLVVDRETTIEKCLASELTVLPMSLFDQYQMMRKSDKAVLGSRLVRRG